MSASKFGLAQCALLAALWVFAGGMSTAKAADLGGDCCADLEERIAELEATTARKGNRKVSLTITGWVNEAVFFWDDGTEQNVYVGTNSLEQSRVKFTGDAKINGDWSAGYTLELGINGHASNKWDQNTISSSSDGSISVRKSNWFLKSKTLGKLTVGLDGTATYHLLDDADGVNTRNYSDAQAAAVAQGAFLLRSGGAFISNGTSNLRWSGILAGVDNGTVGQNTRRNIVRYDTPEFAGFVGTASWGEDDMWGVALTYKNTLGDFKVLGKIGYEHNADEGVSACNKLNTGMDCEWWGTAATIQHAPTGLYVYGGYAEQVDNTAGLPVTADDTSTLWFVQAGIEQKFIDLGKTTIFGEYRKDNAGSRTDSSFGVGSNPVGFVQDSNLKFWAAGVVQNIDAAAMDLYLIYRHADGNTTNSVGDTLDLDAFDMVMTGARIQF
ncbi:MAG: porin [Hyphomicrobium sp.]